MVFRKSQIWRDDFCNLTLEKPNRFTCCVQLVLVIIICLFIMLRSTSGYVSLKQSSASPRVSIGADFVHIIHGWCDTYCGEVWSRSCWWQDAAAVARTVQHRFATISVLALSPLHDGRDQTVSDLTPPKPSLCDLSHPAWRHHQLPIESLVIDTVSVDPVTSGRHLEVHLDFDMSIDTHLSALASTSW